MNLPQSLLTILLFFFIITNQIFAQPQQVFQDWFFMDKATIPAPSKDMPDYARLLYADQVDMLELDLAFKDHYDREGWQHQLEDLEHDPYAKFFHHWYEAAQPFIDEKGIARNLNTSELLNLRKKNEATNKQVDDLTQRTSRSPTSAWSFLGPKRTLWRVDHRADQPVAPWQVNIYSIAVAPANPSILYCGSETGALYKSIDKGLNWTPFNAFNFGRAILSIAIHPTNSDIVYAATSTDILKTLDGGLNWTILKTEAGLSCNSIAVHPSQPEIVFAGTANGLYRSTDGGDNWTKQLDTHIDDVVFRPEDGSTVYALARNGTPDTYTFYKSIDTGNSFNPNMTGWDTYFEHSGGRITVTPADPDYLYLILLTEDNNQENQKPVILKSTNAAENWEVAAIGTTNSLPLNNGQGYYDLDIVVSHSDPEHVIAATTSAYRSTDGGHNWTIIGGYGGDFAVHPDMQEMISIMDNGTENTWMTTDGGINFSTDFYNQLDNWEARIDGLDGTDFWGFAQGWNEDYLIGGRYHNGNTAMHEDYPEQEALRLGGAESVTGWAMHGRERYAAFDDINELILPKRIDEAPAGTFLFTRHPQTFYYGDAFSRVMVDLEDFMTIYLGDGNDFWRSEDGGGSWESLFTFPGKPYHFDISRADANYIYLTTDLGFYRSTDRGISFSQMPLPDGLTNWHSQNLRVAASSNNKDVVWVLNQRSGSNLSAGRIFVSTDGGATWTDLTTPTLSGRKWTALAHQAGTNGGIYLASRRGTAGTLAAKVMYRDDSMNDWADFSDNLPESANPIKLLPFYRDGKLRWAGNRGVWEIDFYEENWTPIVQPFLSGKKQICARDTVEFDSYSVVKGSAGFNWEIPGASFTTNLNRREVKALFPGPGIYTATLTIQQDGFTQQKSIEITVGSECEAEAVPGLALSLSGESSDYAATSKALNITSNTMTFSAWIKRDGDQNEWAGLIFMRSNSAANGLNFGANNELRFHWNNSQWWWSSGLFVPDNEWTHVAMVVSPTETTLYLNGVPSVNNTVADPSPFDGVINFGADPNWNTRRFKGEMDELMIYNRAMSQNEIRELMHLTRKPTQDPGLIGYWQFNRDNGLITDRVASNHASLLGAASRVTSTAPVGPGASQRLDLSFGGSYNFVQPGLTIELPDNGGTFPNGEVCVTRLDINPDQLPNIDAFSPYWVIHNYGSNFNFDTLSSITFDSIGEVTVLQAADPSQYKYYTRASNAHGNTWSMAIDSADTATEGIQGNVSFSLGNAQTNFGQYVLSFSEKMISTSVDLWDFRIWLTKNKEVELLWTSNTEEHLAYYEIQRSKDGISFEKVGEVKAKGLSTEIQTYRAIDHSPYRGVSFYRLKQISKDGSHTYSEFRKIVVNALAESVVLYPNPLPEGKKLTIKTESNEAVMIRLYRIDGEEVKSIMVRGDTQLSLSDLPGGVYSYMILGANWRKGGVLVVE